jgi:hypothetical protein
MNLKTLVNSIAVIVARAKNPATGDVLETHDGRRAG